VRGIMLRSTGSSLARRGRAARFSPLRVPHRNLNNITVSARTVERGAHTNALKIARRCPPTKPTYRQQF
jgi:hypothetical protein